MNSLNVVHMYTLSLVMVRLHFSFSSSTSLQQIISVYWQTENYKRFNTVNNRRRERGDERKRGGGGVDGQRGGEREREKEGIEKEKKRGEGKRKRV